MPSTASLSFDGTNDVCWVGDSATIPFAGGDWTVEAWYKDQNGSDLNHSRYTIVGHAARGMTNSGNYFNVGFRSVEAAYKNSGTNYSLTYRLDTAPEAYTVGEWIHLACTYDATNNVLRIYVDGTLRATSGTLGNDPPDAASVLSIGAAQNNTNNTSPTFTDYALAKLDEVRIWNVRRNDAEIADYYNKRAAGTETGLVIHYRADEGSGTTLGDNAGALDMSITGAAWDTVDFPTLTDAGGGGVEVTPTAISLVLATVNPTVELGAISITPAAGSFVAATVAPTVELGSVSVTPAASSLILADAAPAVALGSLSITPAASSAVLTTVAPAVTAGGDVEVTPAAIAFVAATVDPVVTLGSVSVMPAASAAVLDVVAPAITLGSIAATPTVASLIAATVDPAVQVGGLSVTPTAGSLVLGVVAPLVTLGSTVATPAAATLVLATVAPSVPAAITPTRLFTASARPGTFTASPRGAQFDADAGVIIFTAGE